MKDAAPTWRKSSHSSTQGGDCVELAGIGGKVGVRDSKAPQNGQLAFDRGDLRNLLNRVKDGELDLS